MSGHTITSAYPMATALISTTILSRFICSVTRRATGITLPDFDLSQVYLNTVLSSTVNGFLCEIVGAANGKGGGNYTKECGVVDMKVSGVVNMSFKTSFNIRLKNHGSNSVHIWLTRLVLEYVMFY
jgi:hypothetical protein